MVGLYSYNNYRAYLENRLGGQGTRTGLKTRAAEALSVNTTLISQILKNHCDLSLEQAEKMNGFLGHSQDESDYFMFLVLSERAGSIALKKRFEEQASVLREKTSNLSHRVAKDKMISVEDQERFYSSYIYSALHVLSSIPKLSKASELARILGASETEILTAIEFLKKIGLVVLQDGYLKPGNRHVHLSKDSPLIVSHHLNWRLRTIDQIRKDPKQGLHYSGALSLSAADLSTIKEILIKAISQATDIAVNSKEEAACVMCLDFYEFSR